MRPDEKDPSEREKLEIAMIKSLMSSYFNIVRKNFMDLVPKTIMAFLINNAKDELHNELVAQLYKEDTLAELLQETGDIAQRRQNCAEMRTLLKSALKIVTEVRDYNAFK